MKTILALAFAAFPLLAHAQDDSARRAQIKHLGGAVKAYGILHENKLPAKLSDLHRDGLADKLSDFVSPGSGTTITSEAEIDAKGDYTMEPLGDKKDMLVREKIPAKGGNTVLAIFADGKIEALPVSGGTTEATKPPSPPPTSTAAPSATAAAVPSITPEKSPTPNLASPAATAPAVSPTPTAGESNSTGATRATPSIPARSPTPGTTIDENPQIVIDKNEEFPPFDLSDFLGVSFALQKDGSVIVSEVKANSVGAQMGLASGDRIVEINNKPIPMRETAPKAITQEELGKLVGVPPDSALQIVIERGSDKERMTISLPPSRPPSR
jgi:DNA-binding XRE family transcriptional regulator